MLNRSSLERIPAPTDDIGSVINGEDDLRIYEDIHDLEYQFSKRLLKFKRLNYNPLIEKGLIEALTIGVFMIAGWINLIYRLIY